VTAGLIAIGSAVVTAIQGAFTRGTSPAPATGFTTPAATIMIIMVASAILIGVSLKPHHWSPQTSPHHWKAPATQMADKSPHHW
jgi:drug/metabolite transporter (DMT)-like permease